MVDNPREICTNENGPEGALTPDPALDIATPVEEVPTMPDTRHYYDSARLRKSEQNQHRETPGSAPWKAAVIRDLREGFGVEDIAHRMDCDIDRVRDLVRQLRRHGLLPRLYADARCNWKPLGAIAQKLVTHAGGSK